MTYSGKLQAVLDACVLYPAPIRDLLLSLAAYELYKPHWTKEIQEEWIRNLLLNRPDLREESLTRTVQAMNGAFPDANVRRYSKLVSSLVLPDEDDKHVLAAAIKSGSSVIVTYNLKHFPKKQLSAFDAVQAFKSQVERLKNPPQSAEQVLVTLENSELTKSMSKFRRLLAQGQ